MFKRGRCLCNLGYMKEFLVHIKLVIKMTWVLKKKMYYSLQWSKIVSNLPKVVKKIKNMIIFNVSIDKIDEGPTTKNVL